MGKKKETDAFDALLFLGFVFPIYLYIAPRSIRGELFRYSGRFIAAMIGLAILWFIVGIIRDKIRHRRWQKEQEKREQWQREIRKKYEEDE